MKQEQLDTLAGLEIACRFLFTAIYKPPSETFISALASDELLSHWPVDTTEPLVKDRLDLISGFLSSSLESKLKLLQSDFSELFIGPGPLKAVPWASVYLTEEQLVMTEPTLAVRAFYREFGVEIDTGENEPDDHLGLQLAFIAHLLHQLVTAAVEQQPVEKWLSAIQVFLTDHVLTWSSRFLHTMADNANTDFYKGLANLTEGTLKELADFSGAQYRIVKLYR